MTGFTQQGGFFANAVTEDSTGALLVYPTGDINNLLMAMIEQNKELIQAVKDSKCIVPIYVDECNCLKDQRYYIRSSSGAKTLACVLNKRHKRY